MKQSITTENESFQKIISNEEYESDFFGNPLAVSDSFSTDFIKRSKELDHNTKRALDQFNDTTIINVSYTYTIKDKVYKTKQIEQSWLLQCDYTIVYKTQWDEKPIEVVSSNDIKN